MDTVSEIDIKPQQSCEENETEIEGENNNKEVIIDGQNDSTFKWSVIDSKFIIRITFFFLQILNNLKDR